MSNETSELQSKVNNCKILNEKFKDFCELFNNQFMLDNEYGIMSGDSTATQAEFDILGFPFNLKLSYLKHSGGICGVITFNKMLSQDKEESTGKIYFDKLGNWNEEVPENGHYNYNFSQPNDMFNKIGNTILRGFYNNMFSTN